MSQADERRRGWPPLWMGVVASVAVGGSLLALGVGGSAPAPAAWGCLNLVAALGVYLRTTWGFLLQALLGMTLCAIAGSSRPSASSCSCPSAGRSTTRCSGPGSQVY